MPVYINEIIAEIQPPDSREDALPAEFAADNEQEERLLRQLKLQDERQRRLQAD